MEKSKQIRNNILASVLFIVFMLPFSVQFIHSFEEHASHFCVEKTTHIHQLEKDCNICHFHFFNFEAEVVTYPDFVQAQKIFVKEENLPYLHYKTSPKSNKQLRAPPIYS